MQVQTGYTATHWGNFHLRANGEDLAVHAAPGDLLPSPLGQNLRAARAVSARILTPVVRQGYLEQRGRGGHGGRGREPFVAVGWDRALDLAADAMAEVRARHGGEAIYGGSYGWASAGRFHHAQGQVHRFLRMGGGYTDSVNTYSAAAAEVIVPHIIGLNVYHACAEAPPIEDILAHCRLIVSFGGAGIKNNEVGVGSVGNHAIPSHYQAIRAAGIRVVSISCIRDDTADVLNAEWLPCHPNSDTALMLALCHTLLECGGCDRAFLDRYCHGFSSFEAYLTGECDGVAKDALWASALTGIDAGAIRALAVDMAQERTLIGLSLSLQRAQYGEQPYWAATALAAMLGQIGLPGGGIAYGYSSINMAANGRRGLNFAIGALPQGANAVRSFIPVARIADMLLRPGEPFDYDGQRLTYPDIRLIYWAGGNPFHHHQDLKRLEEAWDRPDTIIVNETSWTATARRADIVFPVSSTLERVDFAGSSSDTWLTPMTQIFPPLGESRSDYEIFSGLAERLGYASHFTEGRTAEAWTRHLYEVTVANASAAGVELPPYEEFMKGPPLDLRPQLAPREFALEAFRRDPSGHPLPTETGKIQIFSDRIAAFGYDDCRGHPMWFDRTEWRGAAQRHQLHLVSNQPANRLHSQLDYGSLSKSGKRRGGREQVRIHPDDARERNIVSGDVVRIFNDRGATLAVADVSAAMMPGVIQLPTGAWYDPQLLGDEFLEVHGNPNALTLDEGASRLAQGSVANSCLCEVERFEEELPTLTVDHPPEIIAVARYSSRDLTGSLSIEAGESLEVRLD